MTEASHGRALARRRKDEFEQALEGALAPGEFVSYHASSDFVDAVEAVRAKLTPLLKKGEGARTVPVLETFVAGCYEKRPQGSLGLVHSPQLLGILRREADSP